MRYLALVLVLTACSSGTSPVADAGPVDAGAVDAGRPDPLRLPDGGCPACERDGICQQGDAVDACGSSGACVDCERDQDHNNCAVWVCQDRNDGSGNRCDITGALKPEGTACALGGVTGACPSQFDSSSCKPCGHPGEQCCLQFSGVTDLPATCVDGGLNANSCQTGVKCP